MSRRAKLLLTTVFGLVALAVAYIAWMSGVREPLQFCVVQDNRHERQADRWIPPFVVEVRNTSHVSLVLTYSSLVKRTDRSTHHTHFLDQQVFPYGAHNVMVDREHPVPPGGTTRFHAHYVNVPPEWFHRNEEYELTYICIPEWKHRMYGWLRKLPESLQGDWSVPTVELSKASLDVSQLRDYPPSPLPPPPP